ncbi:MAG: glycosyltransferase, partial [Ideonella sp.]
LREVVENCHFHWGDSAYNVSELISHGAVQARCAVVPIVVDADPSAGRKNVAARESGSWLFVGRVAANKAHARLIETFAAVKARRPELAQRLVLVGDFEANEPAYLAAQRTVKRHGLESMVAFDGKVSDDRVVARYEAAELYVSLSEHEGFGVPLIEAALHGVPVVALDNTAVGETLGHGGGLVVDPKNMIETIIGVAGDAPRRRGLLEQQQRNAERFTADAVEEQLAAALAAVLPASDQFKTVSIVVCTYNRADLLDRCLDYLQYQTNPSFEVIVVDGPSDDGTDQVIERHRSRIKVARNPLRNLSVSRNLGIELASGDLIAFIDDDALPFDDWVDTLLREFNARPLTLCGLGGPVYYAGSLDFQAQDIGINRFAETDVEFTHAKVGRQGWERSLLGTNTCFRATALLATGGFDEQFDYFLDESELCYRLQKRGGIVAYCPDLFLRHEFAQSHNRSGKHRYNWFTICKNTAYFIAVYSGLEGRPLQQYLLRRMEAERIGPLRSAVAAGELTQVEFDRFTDDVRRGVKQGLLDAREHPRTRELSTALQPFLPFVAQMAAAPVAWLRSLHVCIITKEFPPFIGSGGIGTLYYNLASELLLMGHRVTVLVPSDRDVRYERGRFALRHVRKRFVCEDSLEAPGFVNNLNWSTSALHAVASLHEAQPIDVIDSALWDSEALAVALLPIGERPPLVVRLVTPISVAARLNGWSVPAYEFSLFRAAEKALIEAADAVVPISESIASTIEDEHGLQRDRRWHLSHCGIAYWPFFASHLGYAELGEVNGRSLALDVGDKMLLFVGRLEGRKGVDELVAAAAVFLRADPVAHLVMAGRDVDGFAARALQKLPAALHARLHLVGHVDDATRDKLLHAAHAVIFP